MSERRLRNIERTHYRERPPAGMDATWSILDESQGWEPQDWQLDVALSAQERIDRAASKSKSTEAQEFWRKWRLLCRNKRDTHDEDHATALEREAICEWLEWDASELDAGQDREDAHAAEMIRECAQAIRAGLHHEEAGQ